MTSFAVRRNFFSFPTEQWASLDELYFVQAVLYFLSKSEITIPSMQCSRASILPNYILLYSQNTPSPTTRTFDHNNSQKNSLPACQIVQFHEQSLDATAIVEDLQHIP